MTDFASTLSHFRKRKGASQLALALAAGTTQRYVSFLETGRSRPGFDVVDRLACALELGPGDRGRFLLSAGFVDRAARAEPAPAEAAAIARILEQQNPYPAVIVDTAQNHIQSNAGYDRLMEFGFANCERPEAARAHASNLCDLFFQHDGFFANLEDPATFTATVLGRVLQESHGDPDGYALVDRILGLPHVAALGASPDAHGAESGALVERYRFGEHPVALVCMVLSLGVPSGDAASRLRVELFHPADAATDDLIRSLAWDQPSFPAGN